MNSGAGLALVVAVALAVATAPAQAQTAAPGFEDDDVPSAGSATPPAPGAQPSPDDYEGTRATALAAGALGHFAKAADGLEPLHERYPEDFEVALDLAYYRLRAAEYRRAAAAYRDALRITPGHRDARRGLVDALVGGGELDAALAESAVLVERDPVASILDKHAFILFSLARYPEAEGLYRRALEADATDRDARLGLAFCAQRLGRRGEARAGFERLIAEAPRVAEARQGLALLGPASTVSPHAYGQLWLFPNNAKRGALWSLTTGFEATFLDRFTLGLGYRHFGDAAAPAGAPAGYSYAQDEGHLRLALDERGFGAALYASVLGFPGWVLDTYSTSRATASVLGAQGRVTRWATVRAALQWTHFGDADLAQLDVGVDLPVARLLTLSVGGRTQRAADGFRGSGRIAARLHGERLSLLATLQAGSEWRAYDVEIQALYNLNDLLRYGAELRGVVPIARWLDGYAAFGWERMQPITSGADYDALRITFGLVALLAKESTP